MRYLPLAVTFWTKLAVGSQLSCALKFALKCRSPALALPMVSKLLPYSALAPAPITDAPLVFQ